MNQKQAQQSESSTVWTTENKLYSRDRMGSVVYVKGRSRKKVRKRRRGRSVRIPAAAADGMGRFFLGPLHSGVLQQEMHTEFMLPVQNCW